jgi:hypothetical protein
VGAVRDLKGLAIGGVGVGAGRDLTGLAVGAVGVGVGRDLTGLVIGGAVGAGGHLRGVAVAVAAPQLTGFTVGLAAGTKHMRGIVIAPAYFRVERGGTMRGASLSAFNHIRGRQQGLTIGLLNIADELHDVQIGLINIARNKQSFSVLPFVNFNR